MTDEHKADRVPVSRTPRSIPRIVFGAILIGFACAVAGLLVGATIGANLAVDIRFSGNRGYESTGLLGAITGFVIGVVGSAIAFACLPGKTRHHGS